MEALQALITVVVDLMKIEFEVFGFTLSWWSITLWGMVATVVIILIVGFLHD